MLTCFEFTEVILILRPTQGSQTQGRQTEGGQTEGRQTQGI